MFSISNEFVIGWQVELIVCIIKIDNYILFLICFSRCLFFMLERIEFSSQTD